MDFPSVFCKSAEFLPMGEDLLYSCKIFTIVLQSRYKHSAWSSPVGLVLIGGFDGSLYRTELLTDDGQSFDFFRLKYETG